MIIQGGTGNGYSAGVTANNMLETLAITASVEHYINHDAGLAFHCLFEQAPTAADDCVFYMVNNSDTRTIVIEGIDLYVSKAAEVYVKLNAKGTRNAATALTPANCNAGAGTSADGTFERGVDLDGGAATLAGGTEVQRWKFIAETASGHRNFEQDIVLPKNSTLTIWADTAATNIMGTVVFNFHEMD